jgi:nicotinamidase-related amidase
MSGIGFSRHRASRITSVAIRQEPKEVSKALLVIDVQNDYFPGGKFPLWNAEGTLAKIEAAISRSEEAGIPVINVQHVFRGPIEAAPFFADGTDGVVIHPRIVAATPQAVTVVKESADSFRQTNLAATLQKLGTTELLVCGMMTHNCVTHTAISEAAKPFKITVLPDCCITVSQMIHLIALQAIGDRVPVQESQAALSWN